MKYLRRPIVILILLSTLVAAYALFSIYSPYRGFSNEVFLDFPKGTPTTVMADRLAQAGVIKYPWQFLLARGMNRSRRLITVKSKSPSTR